MTRKIAAALAVALMLAPAAVIAADKDEITVSGDTGAEMRRVWISFKDLDLNSADGKRVADARIKKAADVVCAWATGTVLPETEEYRTCRQNALDNARGPQTASNAARMNVLALR